MKLSRASWKPFVGVWMFSGRSLQVPACINERRSIRLEGRTCGFFNIVFKQMYVLWQVTKVLSFFICTMKEFASSSTSVSLARLSTQKEEFYSLLPGEIMCQASECWTKCIFFLLSHFQKVGDFHKHICSSRHPLMWSLLPWPVHCQEGHVLDLVCWRYSVTTVENRLCPFFFIHRPATGPSCPPCSYLGRKHARSGCESASKRRPGDAASPQQSVPPVTSYSSPGNRLAKCQLYRPQEWAPKFKLRVRKRGRSEKPHYDFKINLYIPD